MKTMKYEFKDIIIAFFLVGHIRIHQEDLDKYVKPFYEEGERVTTHPYMVLSDGYREISEEFLELKSKAEKEYPGLSIVIHTFAVKGLKDG